MNARAVLFTVSVLAASCGYRFVAPGGPLPQGIRTVSAPVFDNRTAEPGAETFFTQAFREQLLKAGALGDEGADAEVRGALLSVTGFPLMASPGRLPSYRLTIVVDVQLRRAGKSVASVQVTGTEDYLSGADLLLTEAQRQTALRRAAEALMKEAYERLATGF